MMLNKFIDLSIKLIINLQSLPLKKKLKIFFILLVELS